MHYGYPAVPIYTSAIEYFQQSVIVLIEYLPMEMPHGYQSPELVLLMRQRLHTGRLWRGEEAQHTSGAPLVATEQISI